MRNVIGGLVILVLVLVAASLVMSMLRDDQAPLTSPIPRASIPIEEPFWGKVKRFSALNDRVLEVKVRLLNTGNNVDEGECDLIAYDRTGAVASLPITTGGPATPSYGVIVTKRLKIDRGEGALGIQRVEVAC